jgi:hypothetical protein
LAQETWHLDAQLQGLVRFGSKADMGNIDDFGLKFSWLRARREMEFDEEFSVLFV